jgi:hypothetical protein
MKRRFHIVFFLAIFQCLCFSVKGALGVEALFDVSRDETFFDFPYPSDAFYRQGDGINLSGYPLGATPVSKKLIRNYVDRLHESSFGFGLNSAVYFRFSEDIQDLPESIDDPSAKHPVFIFSLEENPVYVPLYLKYYQHGFGDPVIPSNLLVLLPQPGAGFRSGVRYAAVVTKGLKDAEGNEVERSAEFDAWIRGDDDLCSLIDPGLLLEGLASTGLRPEEVVCATVFTTIDLTGAYELIRDDLYERLEGPPYDEVTRFREVKRLVVHQGKTPSGKRARVYTAEYTDGTSEDTYFSGFRTKEDIIDLSRGNFPHRVFELYIYTPNYQGRLDERPYGSKKPWQDLNYRTGRIKFEQTEEGELVLDVEPEPESIRITLLIPRDDEGGMKSGCPVIIWDHGTGGSAYSPIRRLSYEDNMRRPLEVYAKHGVAVVGIDGPLHGKRYEMVDHGYMVAWNYFNMLNYYAFQGNLMQGGVDSAAVYHFVRNILNDFLARDDVLARGDLLNPEVAIKGGHSLGGIVSHMGLYMADYDAAILSGDGEKWPLSLLDTKHRKQYQFMAGMMTGSPPWTWKRIDGFHPHVNLILTWLEPANPVNYCYDTYVPITFFAGKGDTHVSNRSTYALDRACPYSRLIMFEPSGDYDSHYCTWREDKAVQEFENFFKEFFESNPR